MSDEDEKSGSITGPEEEALRLKTLAEEEYNSGNLLSALNYAKRAHELQPSVEDLPEILTAFKVLLAAAPSNSATQDYYGILQVKKFSEIKLIQQQYKRLAIILHPGMKRSPALMDAHKLVGEAARVLSDEVRRNEYDNRLRTAVPSSILCSGCRLLHASDRKYLGENNVVCPVCENIIRAMGKQRRVSARIRERDAKNGKIGLGVKRDISSVGEVLEGRATKVTKSGVVEAETSIEMLKGKDCDEEAMTLSQIRLVVHVKTKKKKVVDAEKLEEKENEVEIDKNEERENVREEEREKEVEIDKNEERENVREDERKEVQIDKNEEMEEEREKEVEINKNEERENVREEDRENVREEGREKEKEMVNLMEKSEMGEKEMKVRDRASYEKGSSEIMPSEDRHFYDFGKDRKARCFKLGQVWAVYDDDGMPRHYGLIVKVKSRNPFRVTLIYLRFQSNKDETLRSWPNTGCYVPCGIFQRSRKVTFKTLHLFSHIVDCEMETNDLYRMYPKEGSIWAMYKNSGSKRDKDTSSYDIVVCLSSYSDIHGLSFGYLENVPRFRTVYKRRGVGADDVVCIGPKDVRLLSHQIPAKKLSGEESADLPKEDCWELDSASLNPQLPIDT